MGISSETSEISGGRTGLEEELTLRRREGPLFAKASFDRKSQFGGCSYQTDSKSNRIVDPSSLYPPQEIFSNVLTKPPGGEPRGFSSNTCSSCSFCMKNSCTCKSSDCATCVNAENLPKRGWSARGPPEEIYNYFQGHALYLYTNYMYICRTLSYFPVEVFSENKSKLTCRKTSVHIIHM